MTEDRTECNETGWIHVSLSRIYSLSYMVGKALAVIQKGVRLSSLCLPSSTALNINGCTHTSHIHGYFNCLQIFFNARFDLLPLQTFCFLCLHSDAPFVTVCPQFPCALAGSVWCSAREQTLNHCSQKYCGAVLLLKRRDGTALWSAQAVTPSAQSCMQAAVYWCH